MILNRDQGLTFDIFTDLIPSHEVLDALLDNLPAGLPYESLSVMEPHLPLPSEPVDHHTDTNFDLRGYSSYLRVTSAMVQVLQNDRQLVKSHLWTLRHIFSLIFYTDDFLNAPSGSMESYAQNAPKEGLREIMSIARQLITYILSSASETGLHTSIINSLSGSRNVNQLPTSLEGFIADTVQRAIHQETTRETRTLYSVLQHSLSNATPAESNAWFNYSRTIEKTGLFQDIQQLSDH